MEPIVYVYIAITVFVSLFLANRFVLWTSTTEELIKEITSRHDVFVILLANEMSDSQIVGGKHDGKVQFNLNTAFTFRMKDYLVDPLLQKINSSVLETRPGYREVPSFPEEIE